MLLAVALGYPAADRVIPVESKLPDIHAPQSASDAAEIALRNNKELRQMQSNVLSKELELRSYRSARWPQFNLVAQYSLFARYNYVNYFQKFQRNNGQLGASITIPLIVGSASKGLAEQATTDMQKLRIQMVQVRDRVTTDTTRSYQEWKKAQEIRDLSRMQLDLARESLTVLLAQNAEGRVPLSRVEQARMEESDRWLALYEAETQVTRAQLAILRQMGTLLATLRGSSTEIQP
jgi:outer membrane protein TolC